MYLLLQFFLSPISDWWICLTCQSCKKIEKIWCSHRYKLCIWNKRFKFYNSKLWQLCEFTLHTAVNAENNDCGDIHASLLLFWSSSTWKPDWKESKLTNVEWSPFFSHMFMCCKKRTCFFTTVIILI
jgi:hypothetical protein